MVLRSLVFSIMGLFIAKLGADEMAAHTVSLNVGSFFYMVPVGLSTAVAVIVGRLWSNQKLDAIPRIIRISLLSFSPIMMIFAGLIAWQYEFVASLFVQDNIVIAKTKTLFLIIIFFQLCDGIQATFTGALRGIGDTKISFLMHIFAFWMIALPLGYYLCFEQNLGLKGLWFGLSTGLAVIATGLTICWNKKFKKLNP